MPKFDITTIEREEYWYFYHGLEADTLEEALEKVRHEAATETKFCEWTGVVEVQKVFEEQGNEIALTPEQRRGDFGEEPDPCPG
jgi:hypothetical protein